MADVNGAFTSLVEELPIDAVRALRRAIAQRGLNEPQPAVKAAVNLADVVAKSHDILFSAKTVFPFDLFPNTIVLYREKVSITYRPFFFVAKIITIPVRDLLNVEANVGPFFGSLYLFSRYFSSTPCAIHFFKRLDALRLQRLLQGYIICEEQEINCSIVDKNRLVTMLNDLGAGTPDQR